MYSNWRRALALLTTLSSFLPAACLEDTLALIRKKGLTQPVLEFASLQKRREAQTDDSVVDSLLETAEIKALKTLQAAVSPVNLTKEVLLQAAKKLTPNEKILDSLPIGPKEEEIKVPPPPLVNDPDNIRRYHTELGNHSESLSPLTLTPKGVRLLARYNPQQRSYIQSPVAWGPHGLIAKWYEKQLQIYRLNETKETLELAHSKPLVGNLKFPLLWINGETLMAIGDEAHLYHFDKTTGELFETSHDQFPVKFSDGTKNRLSLSPEGMIAVPASNLILFFKIDPQTRKLVSAGEYQIKGAGFLQDGISWNSQGEAAFIDDEGNLEVIAKESNGDNWKQKQFIKLKTDSEKQPVFGPGGQLAVTSKGNIKIYKTEPLTGEWLLYTEKDFPSHRDYSAGRLHWIDANNLISATPKDSKINFFKINESSEIGFQSHETGGPILSPIQIYPGPSGLVISHTPNRTILHRFDSSGEGKLKYSIPPIVEHESIAWGPEGKFLVQSNGVLRVFDLFY